MSKKKTNEPLNLDQIKLYPFKCSTKGCRDFIQSFGKSEELAATILIDHMWFIQGGEVLCPECAIEKGKI